VFLGEPRSNAAANAREAGRAMVGPLIVLAALCFVIGLGAPAIATALDHAVAGWAPELRLRPTGDLAPLSMVAVVYVPLIALTVAAGWWLARRIRGAPETVGTSVGDLDAARLGARLHPLHPRDAGRPAAVERRQLIVNIVRPFFQLLFVLVVPPLMLGVIAKTKAKFGGRVGPPLLQPYHDIAKLAQALSVQPHDDVGVPRRAGRRPVRDVDRRRIRTDRRRRRGVRVRRRPPGACLPAGPRAILHDGRRARHRIVVRGYGRRPRIAFAPRAARNLQSASGSPGALAHGRHALRAMEPTPAASRVRSWGTSTRAVPEALLSAMAALVAVTDVVLAFCHRHPVTLFAVTLSPRLSPGSAAFCNHRRTLTQISGRRCPDGRR
jgi:hypothetical protein